MMTQQEGFIEVETNLFNKNPLTKWVRPVTIKRLKLLFDVYAWIFVSRESDLDFNDMENMKPEEFLTWAIYGGYMSYMATQNKKPQVNVLQVEKWVKGILQDDRLRILRAIQEARDVGETARSYSEALKTESGEKKAGGSAQGS